MGNDIVGGEDKKPKGFHWTNQVKLLIIKSEEIMKKLLPCPPERVIAEIEYQTGLSEKKAKDIISIFINREMVEFKEMKYKDKVCKCMVFING